MSEPTPLVVITGPTASGKSALAMSVAKLYGGEIICADSRTVYKGMDIGTAKPTLQDQSEVRHHMIDLVEPNQSFTAADFKSRALQAITEIASRNKLPIMVGGTGLYIDSVIFDYAFGPPADPKKRKELQELTVSDLQRLCLKNAIELPTNKQNKRHLIRAIELNGSIRTPKRLRPNTIVVALTANLADLTGKIRQRAQDMVAKGVVQEVQKLGDVYGWHTEALTGNIYRIFRGVVEGNASIESALERCVLSDRQLAKRQITWLKRNPYVIWGPPDQLLPMIEHFVQQNTTTQSMPPALLSATMTEKR